MPVTSVLDSLRYPGTVRNRAFGHADERPYRRLTADWVRVAVAAVLLTVSVAHHGDAPAELAFKKFWVSLPSGLHWFFEMLSRLGSLWALLMVVAAALVTRRWRLALELVLAGGGAWFLGRLIAFIDGGDSISTAVKHVFDGSLQPTYPTVPLAIMTAVILTASPLLTRSVRRIGPLLAFFVAVGTWYRADAGFNATFAAFVLGLGIAAALYLTFGSPAGRPTVAQVAGALDELGVMAANVRLVATQSCGYTVMLADRADGSPLHVRVYGRDAADTQLVGKSGGSSSRRTPARHSRSRACSRSSAKHCARSSRRKQACRCRSSSPPASQARRRRSSSRAVETVRDSPMPRITTPRCVRSGAMS